ncbi:snRNA-activating protein complex subunit 4 [Tupaia chinensis]|uniref:snRNA-activating protein complex subunit 4 n=1 Tax=Tupaia chinensis TaxID=246437 RepID=L8YDJ6_TUPCH|nr:snRNA-activating protein complex subunit 4 [Tupaia chinensis]
MGYGLGYQQPFFEDPTGAGDPLDEDDEDGGWNGVYLPSAVEQTHSSRVPASTSPCGTYLSFFSTPSELAGPESLPPWALSDTDSRVSPTSPTGSPSTDFAGHGESLGHRHLQTLQISYEAAQLSSIKRENEALRSGQGASLAVVKQNTDVALQNLRVVMNSAHASINAARAPGPWPLPRGSSAFAGLLLWQVQSLSCQLCPFQAAGFRSRDLEPGRRDPQVAAMDVDAERERIVEEIRELERILGAGSSGDHGQVSESSLDSDSGAASGGDTYVVPEAQRRPMDLCVMCPYGGFLAHDQEEEKWGEASDGEDDPRDKALPEDPETCLQLNMVYQEVVREKLAEVSLLLAQNREQQEEVTWDLAGSKGPKVKDGKSSASHVYIGHFMKPYFRDRVTGMGPPANEDTREKAAQGVKTFEELLVTKSSVQGEEAARSRPAHSQLALHPPRRLEYLQQKQSRASCEQERQMLERQTRDAEQEVQTLSQLPEETLLGSRLDSHDWEKISNVNFEGRRSAEEVRKFWQNSEHPSINKQDWSGEEVERLQAIAATHGHLEWQEVAEELGTGRSAFQCLQQFQRHNPALRRRAWTEEEDRVLAQLVQEMRVGRHPPLPVVYYMEGRDSMQLIYRWTKSLDPSLKRGLWAPEEDAKLLRAVAKYGEQDWFRIRQEVPGRSDAQCRDRYLRRLHFSLKKGRWSAQEEEQLLRLIEKYGVGHWAKIASELPHRSGSQCLSKWKIMTGDGQCLLKVPRESVLRVLRTGMAARRRMLKPRRPPRPGPPQRAGPGSAAGPHLQRLGHGTVQNGQRRRRPLHRRLLECRLLLAVSSWVGDVILPCTRAQSPSTQLTSADSIREQLRGARLASTPVFAIFIQEEPESEDENLGELEGRQPGCVAPSPSPVEGALGPCKGPVPSCLDAAADLDVLRTRHALHARKRRRLSGGQVSWGGPPWNWERSPQRSLQGTLSLSLLRGATTTAAMPLWPHC